MELTRDMLQCCSSLISFEYKQTIMEIKNNFKKFLTEQKKDPNDFIKISQFQEFFDEVAKYLFGNVAIVFGPEPDGTKYYLAEIEFYYKNEKAKEKIIKTYKDDKGKDKITESSFYSCTYKRNREAGLLFWHYSGIDICFSSSNNNYGGVLIRSLIKKVNGGQPELIAGPLRCANELMNQSVLEGKDSIPHITELKRYNKEYSIMSTIRQGIETSEKYSDLRSQIKIVDGFAVSKDFPFFCYYVKRGVEEWITKVDGKKVRYDANPEKRGIIRKVE